MFQYEVLLVQSSFPIIRRWCQLCIQNSTLKYYAFEILRKCIILNLKSLNAFKLDVYKVDNIANFVYYGKTRIR